MIDYKVIRANIPLGVILYPNSVAAPAIPVYKLSDFVDTINLYLKNGYTLHEKTTFYDDCISTKWGQDVDVFPVGAPCVNTGSSIMITQCMIKCSSKVKTNAEYGIITNMDLRNVKAYEDMINEELNNGWELHGPQTDLKNGQKRFTIQALVKRSAVPEICEKSALEKNVDMIQSDIKSLSHLYDNINKLNHTVEELLVNSEDKESNKMPPLKCKEQHYYMYIQFIMTIVILIISVLIQMKYSPSTSAPLLLDQPERSK